MRSTLVRVSQRLMHLGVHRKHAYRANFTRGCLHHSCPITCLLFASEKQQDCFKVRPLPRDRPLSLPSSTPIPSMLQTISVKKRTAGRLSARKCIRHTHTHTYIHTQARAHARSLFSSDIAICIVSTVRQVCGCYSPTNRFTEEQYNSDVSVVTIVYHKFIRASTCI